MNRTMENMNETQKIYYQVYADDIRHFKTQKWIVVNYAVLMQGAIITFFNLINGVKDLSKIIVMIIGIMLCLCSVLIFFAGVLLICQYEKDINRYRIEMARLPGKKETRKEKKDKKCANLCFFVLFDIILLMSTVASILFINININIISTKCIIVSSILLLLASFLRILPGGWRSYIPGTRGLKNKLAGSRSSKQ